MPPGGRGLEDWRNGLKTVVVVFLAYPDDEVAIVHSLSDRNPATILAKGCETVLKNLQKSIETSGYSHV
jgi:hypothetical protein